MTKQLSLEDVIQQMNDMFKGPNSTAVPPNKLIINPSQMAVVRRMMENNEPTAKEIFEDEVPKVQQPDHGA